jgi:hypothetical protein
MSITLAPFSSVSPHSACPTNQRVGPPVDTLTLKALLAVPLTAVSSTAAYRFCPAPDCSTVYYRTDGQQVFGELDLRERVYQKHAAAADTTVCYCFGHTVGSIRAELERNGSSDVIERVTAAIQAGQCACDIRNPQGYCCLGNINDLLRQLRASANDMNADNA